ncbi:MAG: ATP-binding protein, partial [Acidobacteria bacterium]|nr:ATP-binding protein [Acidobacteriota bacterium]
MNISTNLNGRLRNTSLPLSRGLLPLFEAVINSIHGLEESHIPTESARIRVVIERDMVHSLVDAVDDTKSGRPPLNDIANFTVTDNGVGFNDKNFGAFLTLDTDHKIDKGGRGIGRLLWLKAFRHVDVASVFLDGDVLRRRVFQFSAGGVTGQAVTDAPEDAKPQTTVSLRGFDARYRTKARKTADAIAQAMLEHCLWHFVREGGCPRIVLEDDGEQICLDELFHEHMHSSAIRQHVVLKECRFDLLHVKLRTSATTRHAIAYCANNRLVLEEKLEGRVPGLHGNLEDEEGEFAYVCYVSSPILDERVRPERSAFDLPSEVEGLFEDIEISWADVRGMVAGEAAKHLDSSLSG